MLMNSYKRITVTEFFVCLSGLVFRRAVVYRIGKSSREKWSGCFRENPDRLSGQYQLLFREADGLRQTLTHLQL